MKINTFLTVNQLNERYNFSIPYIYMQLIRKKMVKSAKESIKQKASNSEIYGEMQAVFIEMDNWTAVNFSISTSFA